MFNLVRIFFLLFLPSVIFASPLKKLIESPPSWMSKQLKEDFNVYKGKKLPLKNIGELYEKKAEEWLLIEFTIDDRHVSYRTKIPKDHFLQHRIRVYDKVISQLAKKFKLPDMVFLISMADGVDLPQGTLEGVPLFAMCKKLGGENHCILIPDFEALNAAYQVLPDVDVAKIDPSWEAKVPKMIWRGSTAQEGGAIANSNYEQFSRVQLCSLSLAMPELIDARFTHFAQLAEPVPALEPLRGEWVSFEKQFKYKYHILVDGNASAYSASGWKFFTNALVFKPNSSWVQWYYGQLQPWVHYVPIEADLSDLLDKIQWAIQNDLQSKTIAKNSREFAITHLTLHYNLAYLHLALIKYSKLKFN